MMCLDLIMVIGSACLMIPFIEYIGPPNCVYYEFGVINKT